MKGRPSRQYSSTNFSLRFSSRIGGVRGTGSLMFITWTTTIKMQVLLFTECERLPTTGTGDTEKRVSELLCLF